MATGTDPRESIDPREATIIYYLTHLHRDRGYVVERYKQNDYYAFCDIIGGEENFGSIKVRLLAAINWLSISASNLAEALLAGFGFLPGYENIPSLTKRQAQYSEQTGIGVYTIADMETKAIKELAGYFLADDYASKPMSEILKLSEELIARYKMRHRDITESRPASKQIKAFLHNPANQTIEYGYHITHGADIAGSDHYVERQELEDICRLIDSDEKRVLINGMGGNGKSEICRQIYSRLDDRFLWIERAGYFIYDASMDDTLYHGLNFLHSDNRAEDIQDAWTIMGSLCDENTIIFIDNLPEDVVQKDDSFQKLYSLNCIVVVTSRTEEIDRFRAIKIGFMDTVQCEELFRSIYDREISEAELVDLEYIINKAAYRHVLTVRILAYACNHNTYNLIELRKELARIGFDLGFFDIDDAMTEKKIIERYERLFDLFRCTKDKQPLFNKGERNILEAFSLFPYKPLDIDLCEKLLLEDAKRADPNGSFSRRTFYAIYGKGWLERSGNRYALHPLIAKMIYERQVKPREDYKAHAELVNAGLITVRKENINMHISVMDGLPLAFVNSICDKLYKYLDEALFHMAFLVAIEYSTRYKHSESLEWLVRLSEADITALDVEHYMPDIYYGMSKVYCDEGDHERSLAFCKLAFEKCKELNMDFPVADGPQNVYWQMAHALHQKGEHEEALKFFNLVFEIRKKTLGEDDPNTTLLYQHIAHVYISKKEYDKAFEYGNLALEAAKSLSTDNVYYIVGAYNMLGFAHLHKSEYDEALRCFLLALEKAGNALDEPNKSIALAVADTHKNMALIFSKKKDYDKAIEHYESSVEIEERIFGETRPSTICLYEKMVKIHSDKENYDKAVECFAKALGVTPTDAVPILEDMANTCLAKGEHDEALKYYSLVLAALKVA